MVWPSASLSSDFHGFLNLCRLQVGYSWVWIAAVFEWWVFAVEFQSRSILLVTLSKKRSQEKSYKVRSQSDMCQTSVILMPTFPWHQMGSKSHHKLVSTLSYLLYTCLCQEFFKWFIFSNMLTLNTVWTTLSHKMQFVEVHWILNSDIVELQIFQQGRNSSFFPPTTTISSLLPLSMNGDLPFSMNGWHPSSLSEQPASSLSRAGILPLSMNDLVLPLLTNGWHPPSLNKWLASILF